jgi:membrane associated rhomboid family serine protease
MRPITDRLSPVIRALVVVDAVLFCFYLVVVQARRFFEEHLALGPGLLRLEVWQPVTALFVHLEPISFFFNILGLWFVGADIERTLGTRRFLIIFLASGIAGNVATGLMLPITGELSLVAGCGQAVLALFVAFGVIYGRTPVKVLGALVLEARTMALIFVGFALVADLASGSLARLVGVVVAILLGYLLAGGRGQELKRLFGGAKAKRARRRYQVLEGGRSSSGSSRPPYLN